MADEEKIKWTCEGCGQLLRAKPELAGKKGKCPVCGEPFVVPAAQTVDDRESWYRGDAPLVVTIGGLAGLAPSSLLLWLPNGLLWFWAAQALCSVVAIGGCCCGIAKVITELREARFRGPVPWAPCANVLACLGLLGLIHASGFLGLIHASGFLGLIHASGLKTLLFLPVFGSAALLGSGILLAEGFCWSGRGLKRWLGNKGGAHGG